MLKGLLGSIAVAGLLTLAPISAQAAEMMDCTDANMMKANGDMDKMAAGEQKTMGMKEMTMAKEMMEKKDMAGCKTHMKGHGNGNGQVTATGSRGGFCASRGQPL